MPLHVIPIKDDRRHERTFTCWCNPDVQWLDPDTGQPWPNASAPLVVHAAADCRELVENLTGEQLEPGKSWLMVEA